MQRPRSVSVLSGRSSHRLSCLKQVSGTDHTGRTFSKPPKVQHGGDSLLVHLSALASAWRMNTNPTAEHQTWGSLGSSSHLLHCPHLQRTKLRAREVGDIPAGTQPSSDRGRTRRILLVSQIWGSRNKTLSPTYLPGAHRVPATHGEKDTWGPCPQAASILVGGTVKKQSGS